MSYPELRLYAEMFFDVQEFRKSVANKVRSSTVDPVFVASALEQYEASEHTLSLAMVRCMRKTVSPEILAWQKEQAGIGAHLLARLLGMIGDPRWAEPMHWEGTGDDRILVQDDRRPRSVSQLWAYCGHGDPARRRSKGMTAEEAASLGRPAAKSLVWNLSCSCVKAGVRTLDDGTKKSISHYGAVYLDARVRYEDREHASECVRCGPSGRPAQVGSPWSAAHQHAAALRYLGKTILKDLWIVAGAQTGANFAPGPSSGSDAASGPGDLSTSGPSGEAGPAASPAAGARPASPGGGDPSPVGPAHEPPARFMAPPARGARSDGGSSLEQRSA